MIQWLKKLCRIKQIKFKNNFRINMMSINNKISFSYFTALSFYYLKEWFSSQYMNKQICNYTKNKLPKKSMKIFTVKRFFAVHQNISDTLQVISQKGEEVICDFTLLGKQNTVIPSMIVNNNLVNKKMFEKCFPMCSNIVLSDGGANQLYATECRDSKKIKGLIGDFDCVKSNILQYYKEKGVALEYVSDPETNDFDKAVEFCVRNGWYQIFCFGAFGGRMDLSLATMHLTSKYCKRYPNLDIVLLGKENIMFPIRKNLNYKIKINHKLLNPYGCGLICFGVSESVETSGFRWNLNSQTRLEWGKFISTCNQIVEEECYIRSSADMFFVTGYKLTD